MSDDRARERALVEQWRRAAPALAELRRQELRNLGEQEALRAIEALLDLLRYLPPRRELSGLVEQQRIFSQSSL